MLALTKRPTPIEAPSPATRSLKMLANFINRVILKRFFRIPLTPNEEEIAKGAVARKYAPAIATSIRNALLLIPALMVLDTGIVVNVLIPTTMVAGTAWYAVSLASLKKKFEDFGMELTTNLFVAFALSLNMLFLASAFSLTRPLWVEQQPPWLHSAVVQLVSAILALVVVGKLLYSILAGSLKYDINDAMLTGQNEAAERFFKQSLSLLHSTSEALRTGRDLQVANYLIGLAFFEVFSNLKKLDVRALGDLNPLLTRANQLIKNPSMKQQEADSIALGLAKSFVAACSTEVNIQKHKSYVAVTDELHCLEHNPKQIDDPNGKEGEEQSMTDTRMSVIFSEMSNLIEEFGPTLFSEAGAASPANSSTSGLAQPAP